MGWGAPSIPLTQAAGAGSATATPSSGSPGGWSSSAPPVSTFAGSNAVNSVQLSQQQQTIQDRMGALLATQGGGGGGTSAADQQAMLALLNQGFDIQGGQINNQGARLGLQGQQLDLKALGIGLQQQGQDINAQQLGLKGAGLGVDQQYLQSLLPDYAKERDDAQQLYASQNRQDLTAYQSARRQQLDAAAAGGAYTSAGTRAGLGELKSVQSEADLQNLVGRFGLNNHLLTIGQNERQTQGDIIKNKLSQQGVQLDLSQVGLNKQDLANQLKGVDLDKLANSLDLKDVQALRDQLAVDRQKAALSAKTSGGSGGGLSSSDLQSQWALEDKLTDIMNQKAQIAAQNSQGSQWIPGTAPTDPNGSGVNPFSAGL